jgi:signal transduction histidine kinase
VHPGTDVGGSLRRPDESTGPAGPGGCPPSEGHRDTGSERRAERPGGSFVLNAPLDDPSGGRGRTAGIPQPLPTTQRRRPVRDHGLAMLAAPPDARARALLAAQETDRRRIARDLHDVVGGALTAVKLSLEAAARQPDERSTQTSIRETVGVLDQAIQAVRELSLDLRPSILDDLGLVPAVRWCLVREARRSGCQASLLASPNLPRLDPELESACFRIVQEALANAATHARASHIRIEIRIDRDRLVLIVEDDGVGFDLRRALRDAPKGKMQGLQEMTERVSLLGGRLDVMSEVDGGTRVQAVLPFLAARGRRRAVTR